MKAVRQAASLSSALESALGRDSRQAASLSGPGGHRCLTSTKNSPSVNRPHYHPPGATLFVTFRLADSIPQATIRVYQAEKDWLAAEEERLRKLRLADNSPELSAHEARCGNSTGNGSRRLRMFCTRSSVGQLG